MVVSSSRSSSDSSSELLEICSSLGGGGALAAVFLCNTVSSLLDLLLDNNQTERHQTLLRQTQVVRLSHQMKIEKKECFTSYRPELTRITRGFQYIHDINTHVNTENIRQVLLGSQYSHTSAEVILCVVLW